MKYHRVVIRVNFGNDSIFVCDIPICRYKSRSIGGTLRVYKLNNILVLLFLAPIYKCDGISIVMFLFGTSSTLD